MGSSLLQSPWDIRSGPPVTDEATMNLWREYYSEQFMGRPQQHEARTAGR
jgi:hypothetical protein